MVHLLLTVHVHLMAAIDAIPVNQDITNQDITVTSTNVPVQMVHPFQTALVRLMAATDVLHVILDITDRIITAT